MENENYNEIDLSSIVRDLIREWTTILLFALSGAFISVMVSSVLYMPFYSTNATLIVTNKGANTNISQGLTATRDLAERFSLILESSLLEKIVQDDLDMQAINTWTTVNHVEETNLLELTVFSPVPMDAYRVANSILDNYGSITDYVLGNVFVTVLQEPTVPRVPENPKNDLKIAVYGFAAGGVLAVAGIAFLSLLRDTVKNERQFKEKIDAKLLGTIYHERKYASRHPKKDEPVPSMLIDYPMRSFRFVEDNRMTASSIRSKLEHRQKKVVLLTSVGENEGKSTVSANVALSLAQEGLRVLLIDCDFRKPSLHKVFSTDPAEAAKIDCDLANILDSTEELESNLRQYQNTSLYLLYNTVPGATMDELNSEYRFQKMMDYFRDRMDVIVLDTAPMALVSDTEVTAQFADASVLIVREDMVPFRQINDTIDSLNNTQAKVLGCVYSNALYGFEQTAKQYGYGSYAGKYGGYYGK